MVKNYIFFDNTFAGCVEDDAVEDNMMADVSACFKFYISIIVIIIIYIYLWCLYCYFFLILNLIIGCIVRYGHLVTTIRIQKNMHNCVLHNNCYHFTTHSRSYKSTFILVV